MTKFEMFGFIASAMSDNAEVVSFCEHERELLMNRRSSASSAIRKPTKVQIANMALKEAIVKFLSATESPMTLTEIVNECPNLDGASLNKVNALVSQLKGEGKVIRTEDKKGRAYFSVAERA